MADEPENTHWIDVVDVEGFYPVKRLGPYATARLAERARRGVLRLLNIRRYGVVVVSPRERAASPPQAGIGG